MGPTARRGRLSRFVLLDDEGEVRPPLTMLAAEAAARLLIRLQDSDLAHLIEAVPGNRSALDAVLAPLQRVAADSWTAAGREAAHHILLVIANNPQKTLAAILARPDVQDALRIPFEEAGARTKDAIVQAWNTGVQQGIQVASQELGRLGMAVDTSGVIPDQGLLDRLLSDVDANVAEANRAFLSTVESTDPANLAERLQTGTNRFRTRAAYGVQTSGQHASQAAQEASYEAAQDQYGTTIKKLWITRFGPGTCGMCAALHGMVRDLGQPFPADATFDRLVSIYGPDLGHPPRHPNCRCRIVPYLSSMRSVPGPTLSSMKAQAKAWWRARAS